MNEKHFNRQLKDLKQEKATGHDNVTSKELILADEAVKPGIKSIIRKGITEKGFRFNKQRNFKENTVSMWILR